MKTYTIIAGVDACGKTSLLGILKNETYNIGIIANNENIINDCLEKEICFTQETTLSGKKNS